MSSYNEYSYEIFDDDVDVSEQEEAEAGDIVKGGLIGIMVFFAAIFSLGMLAVYSIMIYLGSEHHCDNNDLKIWMIVYGSTCLVSVCISWLTGNNKNTSEDNETTTMDVIHGLISLFLIVWLIVGTVWFFGYDVGPNYSKCDELMYKYGKGMIIASWSVLGVVIVVSIIIVSVMVGCMFTED